MLLVGRVISLLIGYAFGLIQTGYFVGKIHKIDIRKHGSGNSGSTNALRTMGTKAGVITFIGDLLKAVAAVLLVNAVFGHHNSDLAMVFELYAGFGVILGHDFPFYLDFKGGKGVASTLGIFLVIDWRIALIPIIVFLVITIFTKYVSLGSITGMIIIAIEAFLFGSMGGLHVGNDHLFETYILIILIVIMALIRHKSNMMRLLKGTESRIGEKIS